ncbi:DegT/DnrJ/EryC1/StrS family aminotransferase [Candidatus Pelagibacter sp.]|jgi:dTDP-3-amino-2,3,6-trideoxy-4-keto-D-glucose/dTDP-3-amino-3,4,6-trideoxy-alpha-D-glucose/dTDP-2,6-dideoxy-D-kanosamine transaminase|nr:DegT/DnrJ/EryC1/StrS family aminotransferase [Candidatus Pelagibacter sp.]
MKNNFLVRQYISDKKMSIRHNYLSEQFKDSKKIFKSINKTVKFNDFTLGRYVDLFEKEFCKHQKVKYAVGVGSGTDAIFLSLKALGIKDGDEVITPTYSFYATAGAIVTAGAKPVFVDVKDDLNIDENKIEKKITKKTKAIVPVHWSGRICNMKKITKLAKKYNLHVVEDACHAILAHDDKKKYAGNFGITGCFSMHPLKNLNVWGDGGIIATNNKKIYEKLRLMRNHGLISRDNCKMYGYNSRLDTIQAAVALEMIKKINFITNSRIKNANYLNKKLKSIKQIKLIKEQNKYKSVYHLYQFYCEKRNQLNDFLRSNKIDSKIHYPKPLHLHEAAKKFKYHKGQFKNAEKLSKKVISIPVHEFVSKKQLDLIINKIQKFYN